MRGADSCLLARRRFREGRISVASAPYDSQTLRAIVNYQIDALRLSAAHRCAT